MKLDRMAARSAVSPGISFESIGLLSTDHRKQRLLIICHITLASMEFIVKIVHSCVFKYEFGVKQNLWLLFRLLTKLFCVSLISMCIFRLTHRQYESYRFLFILALGILMQYFIILIVFFRFVLFCCCRWSI